MTKYNHRHARRDTKLADEIAPTPEDSRNLMQRWELALRCIMKCLHVGPQETEKCLTRSREIIEEIHQEGDRVTICPVGNYDGPGSFKVAMIPRSQAHSPGFSVHSLPDSRTVLKLQLKTADDGRHAVMTARTAIRVVGELKT